MNDFNFTVVKLGGQVASFSHLLNRALGARASQPLLSESDSTAVEPRVHAIRANRGRKAMNGNEWQSHLNMGANEELEDSRRVCTLPTT